MLSCNIRTHSKSCRSKSYYKHSTPRWWLFHTSLIHGHAFIHSCFCSYYYHIYCRLPFFTSYCQYILHYFPKVLIFLENNEEVSHVYYMNSNTSRSVNYRFVWIWLSDSWRRRCVMFRIYFATDSWTTNY